MGNTQKSHLQHTHRPRLRNQSSPDSLRYSLSALHGRSCSSEKQRWQNGKATRSCHELLKNYLGSLQLPRVWAFPIKSHLNFKLVPSSRDCKKGSYFSLATPKLPGSKTQHKLTSNTQSIQQQRINLVSISNIQYRLSGQNNKIRHPTFILLFS